MECLHPYDAERNEIFWRTAVASIVPGDELFQKLTPEFTINHSHKITSAGSCFAQHIGNWLIDNRYHYLRSELNSSQVSSFAFGNLYTPKALLQWLNTPPGLMAEYSIFNDPESGRYLDLLLPDACPDGFESPGQLADFREQVVAEAKRQLANSDCFIFTLGLIEAWVDNNNLCYPSCPGIKHGSFDPNRYRLKVFTYDEMLTDLQQLFSIIRTINPSIRFILTVSPVPLTATATDSHVLVANAYSKSLLRTVAGALSDQDQDVSYFPSYELITTPTAGDFRFMTNRRTVSAQGVDYVMRHWANSLNASDTDSEQRHDIEAVCDDELLDALKRDNDKNRPEDAGCLLTLIGDSHFGKLAKAFSQLQVQTCGGMVMNGSAFAQHKFVLSADSDIMVPLESADARKLWHPVVTNLNKLCEAGLQNKSCVMTNIGLQTHQTAFMFIRWMQTNHPERLAQIEFPDYVEFFNEQMQDQMTIVFRLKEQGHRVIVVSDTPFGQHFEQSRGMAPFVMGYMDAMEYVWQQMGVEFFHAARLFNQEISNPMDYASTLVYEDGTLDWFHGGDAYYEWLVRKLLPLLG